MEDLGLLSDLVLAIVAALVGGIVAQRLGQPVIVGYLFAGVLIGPFTPGPIADIENVQVLAEIGVAFLMFALGAEFSFGELKRLGRVATLGGTLQIAATMAIGPAIAPALGFTPTQGFFLGGLLALSSTVVALKVLMARGEVASLAGRIAVSFLIAQDIAVVPMIVLLPSFAGGGEDVLIAMGLAVAKAAVVMAGAYLLGAQLVPRLLGRAAVARSRELFLLGVVTFALGTAIVTAVAGLSLAFGAFLAGLVIAESDYRTQVVAEVLPLRDLFASLFFVSLGMLLDPRTLVENLGAVAVLVAIVVVGKTAIATGSGLAVGMPGRAALAGALVLGQVGEFSFVLARAGAAVDGVPARMLDLILATAFITIVLSPIVPLAAPRLLRTLVRVPIVGRAFRDTIEPDDQAGALRNHTVICGFGRVARELAGALESRGYRYLVVEYNPLIVRELRLRGVPVVYGDTANPAILDHLHLERARMLAVLVPDVATAEATTANARRAHPRLDIVARASSAVTVERLRRAGATAVVQPEFEAGIEVIHHALRRYGVAGPELVHATAGRRAQFYQHAIEAESRRD